MHMNMNMHMHMHMHLHMHMHMHLHLHLHMHMRMCVFASCTRQVQRGRADDDRFTVEGGQAYSWARHGCEDDGRGVVGGVGFGRHRLGGGGAGGAGR
jgi:hypothetical protein